MLILDFDGTATDAEAEGVPFTKGYLQDIAEEVGWPLERVRYDYDRYMAEILAEPHKYAWMMDGLAVAPATVDPYLRIKPIARKIIREAGIDITEAELQVLLTDTWYGKNYRLSGTSFRPGTLELLQRLYVTNGPAAIVTNSHTDAVLKKLKLLSMDLADQTCSLTGSNFFAWWEDRVFGRAKKYIARDEDSSMRLELPGLDRPVLCDRPHYLELLKQLAPKDGDGNPIWSEVTVVGDIFELDGALPLSLGCRFGLLCNDMTPPYEVDFLCASEDATVLESVEEILPFHRVGRSAA